ncbi:MAG: hypothetical protein ACOY93_20525 [Bacillota bacterium]
MGRADEYIQRMVTNGDVILVYPAPRRSVPEALLPPTGSRKPAASPQADVPPPPPEAGRGEEPPAEEGYNPPPPGYAYEFGTGRLVPIRPDLIPSARAQPRPDLA